MPPTGNRDRVAVIRIMLAAIDAELDRITEAEPAVIMRTADYDRNLMQQNVCPECGINWREKSPNCPRVMYDRHRKG